MRFLIVFGISLAAAQLVGCGEKVEAQPQANVAPSACGCSDQANLIANKHAVYNCNCGAMQCVVAFSANGTGGPLGEVALQCK